MFPEYNDSGADENAHATDSYYEETDPYEEVDSSKEVDEKDMSLAADESSQTKVMSTDIYCERSTSNYFSRRETFVSGHDQLVQSCIVLPDCVKPAIPTTTAVSPIAIHHESLADNSCSFRIGDRSWSAFKLQIRKYKSQKSLHRRRRANCA
jgi:hypothetical protein